MPSDLLVFNDGRWLWRWQASSNEPGADWPSAQARLAECCPKNARFPVFDAQSRQTANGPRAGGKLRFQIGHTKIENTERYRGVDIEGALLLTERTEI